MDCLSLSRPGQRINSIRRRRCDFLSFRRWCWLFLFEHLVLLYALSISLEVIDFLNVNFFDFQFFARSWLRLFKNCHSSLWWFCYFLMKLIVGALRRMLSFLRPAHNGLRLAQLYVLFGHGTLNHRNA